jgi:hypothetical protein
MKARIIEKNGFPKPLGLFLIIVILSLTCFVNLVFAGDHPVSDQELTTFEIPGYTSENPAFDGMTFDPYKIGI